MRILRDRVSKESKGLAYVKYYRAYHAALAYEGCNPRKYHVTWLNACSMSDVGGL